MSRHLPAIFLLAGMLAGCAGQVKMNAGAAGPALPSGTSIMLIGQTEGGHPLIARAQQDVVAALTRRGHAIVADAPNRLEIGLTDRLASTGVGILEGPELSPAKSKKFLQSCKDRTYRIALTYYGSGETVAVTRAWAEEHHCKGRIEDSIAGLAEKAVASLTQGESRETNTRRGTD